MQEAGGSKPAAGKPAAAGVRDGAGAKGLQKGERGKRGATQGVLPGTVFVRGLPLDVSSPEVQSRFESFGRVRSCRSVTCHQFPHNFPVHMG